MGERSGLNPVVTFLGSRWAPLAALTAMNMFNYMDRYVLTALLPEVQSSLDISDLRAGFLATAFMVVYFVTSPLFGWFGDTGSRPRLLGMGVVLWSLATAVTGLATSFAGLFWARAAVGIGEAAYGSIAPSLITDLFKRSQHGRALSFFYLATPVGSALGYLLGGVFGARFGWRPTFFLVGMPGLFLAVLAFRMTDPVRPAGPWFTGWPQWQPKRSALAVRAAIAAHLRSMRLHLGSNRLYIGTVLGYTAYTFGLGGFAFWAPSFMMRERGFSQSNGMLVFGGITVVTGAIGTLTGGAVGDWLRRRTVKGYTWVNVFAVIVGGMNASLALWCDNNIGFLLSLGVAQMALFLVTGPVNALIVGSVSPAVRGTAMATSIFCIHLFGDAISPVLIGQLSDKAGLRHGMMLTPLAFAVAALIWATTLPHANK